MTFLMILKILLLSVVQGMAELLPVSSSAHVIVAEKLMGLDPVSPEMVLLLVMLHTGTMFAVIAYFWSSWKAHYFQSRKQFWTIAILVIAATTFTGILGLSLKFIIEKVFLRNIPHAEIELIFGNTGLIAASLFCVGLLIIYAGRCNDGTETTSSLNLRKSFWIGAVQGICLPFRGFSRSGATISTGLILGAARAQVEEFSFALAVVLTPPVIFREVHRLLKAHSGPSPSGATHIWDSFTPVSWEWSSVSWPDSWHSSGFQTGLSKGAGSYSAIIAWLRRLWCSVWAGWDTEIISIARVATPTHLCCLMSAA